MKMHAVIGKSMSRRWTLDGAWQLVVLSLVLGSAAFAQTAATEGAPKQEDPSKPRLANAPEFSRWAVTFSYPEDRAGKLGQPVTMPAYASTRTRIILTTKTRTILHEELIDAQGGKFELWHVGNIQFAKAGPSGTWLQSDPSASSSGGSDAGFSPVPASGFRDLDWLAEATFAGTVPYLGKSCHVYLKGMPANFTVPDPGSLLKKLDNVSNVAFIDATSGLPVEVRVGATYQDYDFKDAPDAMQTLPGDLAGQIQKGREARAKLYQQAPRPY